MDKSTVVSRCEYVRDRQVVLGCAVGRGRGLGRRTVPAVQHHPQAPALVAPQTLPLLPPPRSAALVGALHLLGNNTEIVKRWVNEIQEAAQNKNTMVQVCVGCKVQGRGQGRKGWLQGVQGLVGAQRSALTHDNNAPPLSSMQWPCCMRCAPPTAWPSASWSAASPRRPSSRRWPSACWSDTWLRSFRYELVQGATGCVNRCGHHQSVNGCDIGRGKAIMVAPYVRVTGSVPLPPAPLPLSLCTSLPSCTSPDHKQSDH